MKFVSFFTCQIYYTCVLSKEICWKKKKTSYLSNSSVENFDERTNASTFYWENRIYVDEKDNF